jgi:hypothetical protein
VYQRRPSALVLFTSGYPQQGHLAQMEGGAFLPKPYDLDQLVEVVRRLLPFDPSAPLRLSTAPVSRLTAGDGPERNH